MSTSKIASRHSSVKVAFKTVVMAAASLILGIVTSCEIEDEYSKPDLSEKLGRFIVALPSSPIKIFWTEQDEIVIVYPEGISAYDLEKNTIRTSDPVQSDNQFYGAWLVGDKIYVLSYIGRLSAIDLATLKLTQSITDSVIVNDFPPVFSSSHISYSKYIETEPNMPSIFLYDFASGNETFVALGNPRLFSPDGSQLLFDNYGAYLYNLSTKATDFSGFSVPYYGVLRWTPKGLISFSLGTNNITITGKNETTGEKIGEWKSMQGFSQDMVSATGNNIITGNDICAYPYVTGYCPDYTKVAYSIVDVHNNTEQTMVYGINTYHNLRAFSPDEKNFAYVVNNQLYITQSQN